MDTKNIQNFIYNEIDKNALPALMEYVKIPNLSRSYDPLWESNGLLEKAGHFLLDWATNQGIIGLKSEYLQEKGRTPTLFMEIAATESCCDKIILMYGHFDKQPHMSGWLPHLSPIKPVIEGDKLYGRGAADDGYAIFSAILSIKALQIQNLSHPNIIILVEGDEESSSQDLPYYLQILAPRIKNPDLIICLDSGALSYSHLWITSSLRGVLNGSLRVEVLKEGVHSGDASGIVPESFRIIRMLLDRLEDPLTSRMKGLQVEIPSDRYQQCFETAQVCKDVVVGKYPWVQNCQPSELSVVEAYLNRCWRPQMSIIGMDGLPTCNTAGNVLRPFTQAQLSIRLAPTQDGAQAAEWVKKTLEDNPPQGAKVSFIVEDIGEGWNAPPSTKDMIDIMQRASQIYYKQPAQFCGEGGSIPFMKMLGDIFPKAQFAVLGILGPQSNAHGPNEFLHIPMTKNLTCCVAQIVHEFGILK